jgi:uncharacterized protein (TIGR00159 family)
LFEGLKHLVAPQRSLGQIVVDIADVLIVAYIFYRALLVLRGTPAMKAGVGFLVFGALYLVAKNLELVTLLSVLSYLAANAILIVVVVFQHDIKRALERVGARPWLVRGTSAQERVIDEVVEASTELARRRIGALICLERDASVLEFVQGKGIPLQAVVTTELLVSLFLPEPLNKTHDGAVLIRNYRIDSAGVFFPMPRSTEVNDPSLGSRHRAAIGITEETDAVVIVVSEERGTITLCFPGGMLQNVDGASLRGALLELVGVRFEKDKGKTFVQRLRAGIIRATGAEERVLQSPVSASRTSERSPSGLMAKSDLLPKPERASSVSGKHPAITKPGVSKGAGVRAAGRSGAFTPMGLGLGKETEVEEKTGKTPIQSRVSVPMPTAKDRKSVDPKDETPTPEGKRRSVSKPMTPTDLPSSTNLGSDDT